MTRHKRNRAESEFIQQQQSPLGKIIITGNDQAVTGVYLPGHWHYPELAKLPIKTNALIEEAGRQLQQYFAGTRQQFELPISQDGTVFQQQVWAELGHIPFGETRSYSGLCKLIGRDKAMRALGSANGANRIAIIVPCHRVIAASGNLAGYAGGTEAKAWLLAHERG